jgi:hypothetical protein
MASNVGQPGFEQVFDWPNASITTAEVWAPRAVATLR